MYMLTPLFLAALALAAPQDALRRSPSQCPSGSYKCSDDMLGWEVCNAQGSWINAGHCSDKSSCYIHPNNNLPYCHDTGVAAPTGAAAPTGGKPSAARSATYRPSATYAKSGAMYTGPPIN